MVKIRAALLVVAAIAFTSNLLDSGRAGDKKNPAKTPAQKPALAKPFHPFYAKDEVRKSIARAVKFLEQAQKADGSWEIDSIAVGIEGGCTALVLVALLDARVAADDPMVARGLKYLRNLRPKFTYTRALQTLVFIKAGRAEDRGRIADNVKWIIDSRVLRDAKLRGWSYGSVRSVDADGSNTHYAVMALHEAGQAGAMIDPRVWKEIRDHYLATQKAGGGWGYSTDSTTSSLSMTAAGICGLCVAGEQLQQPREIEKSLERALTELDRKFSIEPAANTFYALHTLARAGRLSGKRYLPGQQKHDWYQEGATYLLRIQKEDGSWQRSGAFDRWPTVSTSLALLFLSHGR